MYMYVCMYVCMYMYMYVYVCIYQVFPPKGGTMALPYPSVLLPCPFILKFMLKNTVYNTD